MSLLRNDLVIFRRIYAAVSLLLLPGFSWVGSMPDAAYNPPPGLMQLFSGFPPFWFLIGMEILTAFGMMSLLGGRWIATASIALPVVMLLGYGFAFSVGKVDHAALTLTIPWFGLAAGWSGNREPTLWVIRLWAWTIGLAFLTAGFPKVVNGWLNPGTHAVEGFTYLYHFAEAQPTPLSSLMLHLRVGWIWELLDYAALLELLVVVAAIVWRPWRGVLALLCIFHLGVMLLLDIPFSGNVLAYGAFVAWGQSPALARCLAHTWTFRRWLVLPLGVLAWFVARLAGPISIVPPIVVVSGAGIGIWYLASQFWKFLPVNRQGLALATD